MTVTGFSRLEDLIGIIRDEVESKNVDNALTAIDELQGILNQLPEDDDSKYIISTMFNGIKHNQATAQLEVMQGESNFMMALEFALGHEKIREKIRGMIP